MDLARVSLKWPHSLVWQAGYFNDADRQFHRSFDKHVDDLLQALRAGRPPPVRARSGRRALALAHAIIRSFETGIRIDIGGQTVHPTVSWLDRPGGCGGRHGTPWWVRHARASGQGAAGLIAAGGGHQLFWADAGGSVWGANPGGGNPQALVTGQNSPAGVAVGANRLYWTNNGDSTLLGANPDGTNRQAIITTGLAGAGLAVDANHLYFTAVGAGPGRGAIWRANLDGTNQQSIVTGQDSPFGMAVDANHLYWADAGFSPGAGAIWRANLDGSNPEALVTGQNQPFAVAVDANHLYWTNAAGYAAGPAR